MLSGERNPVKKLPLPCTTTHIFYVCDTQDGIYVLALGSRNSYQVFILKNGTSQKNCPPKLPVRGTLGERKYIFLKKKQQKKPQKRKKRETELNFLKRQTSLSTEAPQGLRQKGFFHSVREEGWGRGGQCAILFRSRRVLTEC